MRAKTSSYTRMRRSVRVGVTGAARESQRVLVALKIPRHLRRELKHAAVDEERGESDIITELIKKYLEDRKELPR